MYGPMQVGLIGGNIYFVTFIDDHSRNLWTYLIKRNDEVLEVFKKFKFMVKRQGGHKLKVLKRNSGDEYVLNDFGRFYDQESFIHEVVPPYTPQQNVFPKGRIN